MTMRTLETSCSCQCVRGKEVHDRLTLMIQHRWLGDDDKNKKLMIQWQVDARLVAMSVCYNLKDDQLTE